MPKPLAVLGLFAAVALVSAAGSRAAGLSTHRILVVNEGNEAIFSLRLGHDTPPPVWSSDVLPFDEVIDVSQGREIVVGVDPANCTADLQATYRDDHAVVVKDVDLCTADRVDFTH